MYVFELVQNYKHCGNYENCEGLDWSDFSGLSALSARSGAKCSFIFVTFPDFPWLFPMFIDFHWFSLLLT